MAATTNAADTTRQPKNEGGAGTRRRSEITGGTRPGSVGRSRARSPREPFTARSGSSAIVQAGAIALAASSPADLAPPGGLRQHRERAPAEVVGHRHVSARPQGDRGLRSVSIRNRSSATKSNPGRHGRSASRHPPPAGLRSPRRLEPPEAPALGGIEPVVAPGDDPSSEPSESGPREPARATNSMASRTPTKAGAHLADMLVIDPPSSPRDRERAPRPPPTRRRVRGAPCPHRRDRPA